MNTGSKQLLRNGEPSCIDTIDASFQLSFRFPVFFDNDVFNTENTLLRDTLIKQREAPQKTLVYIDSGITRYDQDIIERISAYFDHFRSDITLLDKPSEIQGGERVKQETEIQSMYEDMLRHSLDRHCCVLAIGGGALLDAVGHACSTFHRGIPLLRMPSTVLAQNDAGIGVKNGYNALGCKNLIGSFSPPYAVINDFSLLETLHQRDRISGLAEAVKVAAIRDAGFFDWLEHNTHQLTSFEPESTQYAIARCAQLHLNQITHGGDPFETGSARPLDYGHWSAHKLESILRHEIRHGEAVAIGMALDTFYAYESGMLREEQVLRMTGLLKSLGFTLWNDAINSVDDNGNDILFQGLEEFRQHLGGNLCITLLTDIGTAVEVDEIDSDTMKRAIEHLQAAS